MTNLKISIGSNIIEGPWGGGNQFAKNLSDFLIKKGWKVTSQLIDSDIDIVLMTEPRKNLISSKYNQKDIARYLVKKPDTIVIHRINECDERKKTKNVNDYLKRANKVADFTVFVSSFVKSIFINKEMVDKGNYSVIKSGANRDIFNSKGRVRWEGKDILKIVTHHWSSNYYKGFDIYQMLDNITERKINGIEFQFNYIGRAGKDYNFRNTEIFSPVYGKQLADKIKENHIYLTASINDPAGNHFLEGALCGLPLLFRNSGGTPEYCKGYGVMFDGKNNFLDKLKQLADNYYYYFDKIKDFPLDSDKNGSEYEKIFIKLLEKRKNFDLKKRRIKFLKIYLKEKVFYRKYKGDL